MSQRTLEESLAVSVRSIMEFPLPQGKIVLGVQGEAPGWVQTTLQTLGQLLTLPRNWDSYGSRPVDPASVWATWRLLLAMMRDDSPVPTVVPTSRGGVQIEWHTRGIDLEIEVATAQRLHVSFEDAVAGEAWEKQVTDAARELSPCIARLSR
jgi:hypothetical protein